jgi:N-acetylneuraminate lyase
LIRAFDAGDRTAARKAQLPAALMVTTLAKFSFAAASKAAMALCGVDCGPVRPPLRNLSAAETAALAEELATFDILTRAIEQTTHALG